MEVICPEKKQVFINISLCKNTIAQEIKEMANNVKQQLRKKINDF